MPSTDAVAATLPVGSVGFEPEPDAKGERLIWLEAPMANRLSAMRGPGESDSDVILRVAAAELEIEEVTEPRHQAIKPIAPGARCP